MNVTSGAPDVQPRAPAAGSAAPVDWQAIERSSEFRELIASRRRFVVPATVFFLAWYFGFIILAGYAEEFMGRRIYEGLTVGYTLALTQFVMTWLLGWMYLRHSDRHLDPLRRRALAQAERLADRPSTTVQEPPENAPLPPREVKSR
jgi:uncharacterized membrane protein (DUF485 family)